MTDRELKEMQAEAFTIRDRLDDLNKAIGKYTEMGGRVGVSLHEHQSFGSEVQPIIALECYVSI